jgi:transposase
MGQGGVEMAGKRRRFDREFKLEAVRMVTERGHDLSRVARDLELRPEMLRRWKKELEADAAKAFPGEGRARDEELAQLRRDLKRVTEERDILKKAVAIFSEGRR